MGECNVLSGTTGILVQLLLFLCVLAVLVLKKRREDWTRCRRRTWPVFFLDSSKQSIGAGWLHSLNLLTAWLLGNHEGGEECEWYLVNVVVDDSLGIFVTYVLFRGFMLLLERALGNGAEDYRSGSYHNPRTRQFELARYIKQLAVWLVTVSVMKAIIVLLLLALSPQLHRAASWVLRPVKQNPTAELLVVMIFTPLVMNCLQFWLVDNFIRDTAEPESCEVPTTFSLQNCPSSSTEAERLQATGLTTLESSIRSSLR